LGPRLPILRLSAYNGLVGLDVFCTFDDIRST
jgi:hypothetical protein